MFCWWEYKVGVATVEDSMEVPQKIKNRITKLPYDPAIPLLGIYMNKT